MNGASVKESVVKEERAKLDAIDCLKREKGGRLAAEQMQASLKEELEKAEQDKAAANERVKSLNEMYKRLQEYNTSLQQYNTKLQNELKAANYSSEQVEREKVAILENLSPLRGHHNLLQSELTSFKESRDEAIKQGEIHQVRVDRDWRLLQVQRLRAELISFKGRTGKAAASLQH